VLTRKPPVMVGPTWAQWDELIDAQNREREALKESIELKDEMIDQRDRMIRQREDQIQALLSQIQQLKGTL